MDKTLSMSRSMRLTGTRPAPMPRERRRAALNNNLVVIRPSTSAAKTQYALAKSLPRPKSSTGTRSAPASPAARPVRARAASARPRRGPKSPSVAPTPTATPGASGYTLGSTVVSTRSRQRPHSPRIPGYCGFVKGMQHVAGRSYGRATRRALNKDAVRLAVGEMVPGEPQSTHKITAPDTYAGHVPGYRGYIPQSAFIYGERYGAITAKSQYKVQGGMMHKEGRKALNRSGLLTV